VRDRWDRHPDRVERTRIPLHLKEADLTFFGMEGG
jgi:hypothetical protein